MLTLNFFQTLGRQFLAFFNDAKEIFIDTINTFHRFLNQYIGDDFLLMLLIAIGAFIAIVVFRTIINHE